MSTTGRPSPRGTPTPSRKAGQQAGEFEPPSSRGSCGRSARSYTGPRPCSRRRRWLSRFEGRMSPRALWKGDEPFSAGRSRQSSRCPALGAGSELSMSAMWTEVSRLNLIELAPRTPDADVRLPWSRGSLVPPHTSIAYFDALSAPSKKLFRFWHSGHEPFVDEPDKFNVARARAAPPALRADLPVRAA